MIATPKITYRQYGGKASIAKWIVSHFPEHRTYLEPLCGSAAVLLAKPRSFVEIINDLDGAVMGMWQAIKSQPEQLAALLWATPYTAANWREQPVGDIDQAVLLMAQGAQFYCGNGNSSTWSLDKCPAPHKPKAEVWADWFRRVLPAANRMRGVELLHEDALVAIQRVYRDPEALIVRGPTLLGPRRRIPLPHRLPGDGRVAEIGKSQGGRVRVPGRRTVLPTLEPDRPHDRQQGRGRAA